MTLFTLFVNLFSKLRIAGLDPNFEEARENLAEAETEVKLQLAYKLTEEERFDEALAETEALLEMAPKLAEAHNLYGVLSDEFGWKEKAIAAYREAVRLDPEFRDARLNLTEAEAER